MTVRVLLVDDQALVRAGFRMILGAEDDMCVVGEADDGDDAVRLARSLRPDVVLMDIQMPRLDGVEATRQIVAEPGTGTRVVILTTFERDDSIFEALRVGASGFLLKNAPPEELLHAVRMVADGNALLSPSVTRRVIEQYATIAPVPKHIKDNLERLTDRERQVLCSLASGKSNAEVADTLYVSEGTIKTHVSHILTKLALRDRMQAVVFAYESGLVTPRG
jgi:DNA-binding NarL/FixJ family response regulator